MTQLKQLNDKYTKQRRKENAEFEAKLMLVVLNSLQALYRVLLVRWFVVERAVIVCSHFFPITWAVYHNRGHAIFTYTLKCYWNFV